MVRVAKSTCGALAQREPERSKLRGTSGDQEWSMGEALKWVSAGGGATARGQVAAKIGKSRDQPKQTEISPEH